MSDHWEIEAAQKELLVAQQKLSDMKHDAARSQQIVDFARDRVKSALSELVVEWLPKCKNVIGTAEHQARADKRFKEAMKKIMVETAAADEVLREFDIADKQWRSAQSILSSRSRVAGAGLG